MKDKKKKFERNKKVMKSLISNIKTKADKAAAKTRAIMMSKKGEGYVDSGVKILIAVVIGALLLAGLYTLFDTTIMPTVSTKVQGLFNYSGN